MEEKYYTTMEIHEIIETIKKKLGYQDVTMTAVRCTWAECEFDGCDAIEIERLPDDDPTDDENFLTGLYIDIRSNAPHEKVVMFEEEDATKVAEILKSGDPIAMAKILGKIAAIVQRHIDKPKYDHYKESRYKPVLTNI